MLIRVVLLCAGKYLAEDDCEPKDEDNCFGLGFDDPPYINLRYSSTVNFLLSSIEVDMTFLQEISYSGL